MQNEEGGTFSVLLNIGGGHFSPAQNYKSPLGAAGTFTVGDLAHNGKPDVTLAIQDFTCPSATRTSRDSLKATRLTYRARYFSTTSAPAQGGWL